MIRTAGIVCKPIQKLAAEIVPPLVAWLRDRGIEVRIEKDTQACVDPSREGVERESLGAQVDLLIVLGGDGTLLSAARGLRGHSTPILGVNLGGLGFLTSFTREEMYPMLEMVLSDHHRIGERMMLDAQIVHNGVAGKHQVALNDAVANKGALARMLTFDVHVDKNHVGRYRADGLIVATPTGSTAYSLAAGGPIVQPELDAFVITPICPHMLTNRPLVVPDTASVEIDFAPAEEPVYLTLDGQIGMQLEPDDRVVISKAAAKVRFVRPLRKTYYEVLRSKLRWGER